MDVSIKTARTEEAGFAEIVSLIAAARQRALQSVNTTLIDLYWQVGEYISRKIEASEWGDGIVPQLAQYIAQTQPGQRGFTRDTLFRMTQFYEMYPGPTITLDTQPHNPWPEQAARGARILFAHGCPRKVEQTPIGAAIRPRSL
jgi:hypothetical protein